MLTTVQSFCQNLFITSENFKGYENTKRYLSVNLADFKKSSYWKFILENKVNNIVLLEDFGDEGTVSG